MRCRLTTVMVVTACLACCTSVAARGQETLTLENAHVGLSFDRSTGSLVALLNKSTGETYRVSGDGFAVEALEFRQVFSQFKPGTMKLSGDTLTADYEGEALRVAVRWTLGPDHAFAEKRMTLTFRRPCGLRNVIVSQPAFSAEGLRIVSYRYPKYERKPGTEPSCTFFGRTARGGLFTGVEVPFDARPRRDSR